MNQHAGAAVRLTWAEHELEFDDELAGKGFNPDQPRDRHGRWTRRGGDLAGDVARLQAAFSNPDMQAYLSGYSKFFSHRADPGRLGRCYELSGQHAVEHGDATLIHGSIQGMGQPRLDHAWVKMGNGNVWEPGTNTEYTPAEFNAVFHPQVNNAYTHSEAVAHMLDSGHYGPWPAEKRYNPAELRGRHGEWTRDPFSGTDTTDTAFDNYLDVAAGRKAPWQHDIPAPAPPPAWLPDPHGYVSAKVMPDNPALRDGTLNGPAARKAVGDALAKQARYVPNLIAKTRVTIREQEGRHLGLHDWGGYVQIDPKNFTEPYATDTLKRDTENRWWVPSGPGVTLAEKVTAHEIGHGVHSAFLGQTTGTNTEKLGKPELWDYLANAMGAPPPDYEQETYGGKEYASFSSLDRWLRKNQGRVQSGVSRYGTKNLHEMLAELWCEYTTSPEPRQAAQIYGDWVMKNMPGRTRKTSFKPVKYMWTAANTALETSDGVVLSSSAWNVGTAGKAAIPTLTKVGPEGYIHGWICVRPPCGPKTGVTLKPGTGGTVYSGGRTVPTYTITRGTGETAGYVVPTRTGRTPAGGDIVGFFGHNPSTGMNTRDRPNDDPEGALKDYIALHNLDLMRGKASAERWPDVGKRLTTAHLYLWGTKEPHRGVSAEDAAAYEMREAEQYLAAEKRPGQEDAAMAMDQALRDMYHHLTGEEMPGDPLNLGTPTPPDTPWGRVGKIRKSNLEVRQSATDPKVDEVVHKPTGTVVGTIQQEWISKSHPASHLNIYGDSKAYYTGRLANGSVAYHGTSTAKKSAHENALEWIIDAHNKAIKPRIQPPPPPPVPAPLDKPPAWFRMPPIDVGDVPADKREAVLKEVEAQLTNQARYVPNVVARATIKVKKPSGTGLRNALGAHWGGSGRIELDPNIFTAISGAEAKASLNRWQGTHWWPPADEHWSLADTVLAHEVGHGVADRGLGFRNNTDPALWKGIADGVGVLPLWQHEKKDAWDVEAALNRWMGQNKAEINRAVSTYGTKNMDEMMAEMWQEYTTTAHPRPAAKAMGDYVMTHLANRLDPPAGVK